MILNITFELDDEQVFKRIPEAERTDDLRESVRCRLEDFYGTDDNNSVTEQLLMSAGGEIDSYLEEMREEAVNSDEGTGMPMLEGGA
jgi:hypothetical protein